MISIDTSVAVKWFKPGERYEAEALDLGDRIERGEVQAAANEIISLEIVRGLQRMRVSQPSLGMTEAKIENAFVKIEHLLKVGNVLECTVSAVKSLTKQIELDVGLYMADALHLATAIYLKVDYFVVDDRHFMAPEVMNYAAGFGVQVVNLPDLIAALDAVAP